MTEKKISTTTGENKISSVFGGWSPEEVAIIRKSVAKDTTDVELAYFLNVAKSVGLNPFTKEVWCYKDRKGNVLVFAGRDGFLASAQKSPEFGGIRSAEVKEKDEFSIDIANNKITHKVTMTGIESRGRILGAYAIVFRKGGEPTIEFVEFARYNKGSSAWASHPEDMIKKVAECHALKKAFGISGIHAEDDFRIEQNEVRPLVPEIDHDSLLSKTTKK